jgi:hypothetical protein
LGCTVNEKSVPVVVPKVFSESVSLTLQVYVPETDGVIENVLSVGEWMFQAEGFTMVFEGVSFSRSEIVGRVYFTLCHCNTDSVVTAESK